jgi:hypothetical protein
MTQNAYVAAAHVVLARAAKTGLVAFRPGTQEPGLDFCRLKGWLCHHSDSVRASRFIESQGREDRRREPPEISIVYAITDAGTEVLLAQERRKTKA